ncbi:alpha-glucosidase [Faecalicatena contorta]|uniref:glycoside hydrolase family 13 protein n=2 Tax=Faecalicatena contorta TaxID=39482 RepID=UPI00129E20B2|nr:alpha-glucosidase [Faecalicatena contorta]MRM90686.1 alpha-glucosidase [Faecalicatena contorta]
MNRQNKDWWKSAVVYQVYPRSFQDSNGDGIGDLKGVIRRLDYLRTLGVDIIWLSPVYTSPNDDNGYDISDYRGIMPEFGTMEDFDLLLQEIHNRDMKLVMDMVVNHTSDEHAWFQEAKSSKTSAFRDYYIWRKGKEGMPPNNWLSMFGGTAWEYDETTEEYYLHLFGKKQPDLNWENKKVRNEVYDIMKWWVNKGVDGFRMDVINFISKVPGLPEGIDGNGKPYYENGPRIHEYLHEMNGEVAENNCLVMIGEMPDVHTEDALLYTDPNRNELDMVFSFEHVEVGYGKYGKWSVRPWALTELKEILGKWQDELNEKGWNSLYWSNHDQPRAVSRFGDDREQYRVISAKMLAVCLHMMKGTPFIYQGEELGMTNTRFASIHDHRDIEILTEYKEYCKQGIIPEDEFMNAAYEHGRDNARVPVAWDDTANGGFTDGEPWIKVSGQYKTINARNNLEDPGSVFYFYKKLIELRHHEKIMVHGDFRMLCREDEDIFAYTRRLDKKIWLIVCNFTCKSKRFTVPLEHINEARLIIANYTDFKVQLPEIKLRPYETVVLEMHNN